jgi:hypothetical protein
MVMRREKREKKRMTLSFMNSTGTDDRRAEVMDTALGITIPGGHFSMEGQYGWFYRPLFLQEKVMIHKKPQFCAVTSTVPYY